MFFHVFAGGANIAVTSTSSRRAAPNRAVLSFVLSLQTRRYAGARRKNIVDIILGADQQESTPAETDGAEPE